MILLDCKKRILPNFTNLIPFLTKIPLTHELIQFNERFYRIHSDSNYVYFKIYALNRFPLEFRLPVNKLSSFQGAFDYLHSNATSLFDRNNQIVYAYAEIDLVYMAFQNKLGIFLTKYCKQTIKRIKKNCPNLSLRNVLVAEIFIRSQLYHKQKTNISSHTHIRMRKLLSNDSIITFALKNKTDARLLISSSLYDQLCTAEPYVKDIQLNAEFYSDMDNFFKDTFGSMFDLYINTISQQIAQIKSKRLFYA
ncbi:hypothetical protein MXB_999, partial [Myxobolus squamalis]